MQTARLPAGLLRVGKYTKEGAESIFRGTDVSIQLFSLPGVSERCFLGQARSNTCGYIGILGPFIHELIHSKDLSSVVVCEVLWGVLHLFCTMI